MCCIQSPDKWNPETRIHRVSGTNSGATDIRTRWVSIVHVVNIFLIQTCPGPPSLTSSSAAAKAESLLVLDVEIVDQPETEGATNFQIWMRLADSDSTEQIQHGHSIIAVRCRRCYSNAATLQWRSVPEVALWLQCRIGRTTGGQARQLSIKCVKLLAIRVASHTSVQNALQADESFICDHVPLSWLRCTIPASVVARSDHQRLRKRLGPDNLGDLRS